jgi:hypothetical protein
VVATSTAVRGLSDLPPSVQVADDAGEFADQLARFLDDGGSERPRADALAWSEQRRERLDRAVASLMAAAAGHDGAAPEREPAAGEGSPTRLG